MLQSIGNHVYFDTPELASEPTEEQSEWDATIPYYLDGYNRIRSLCRESIHMTTATDRGTTYCIHCAEVTALNCDGCDEPIPSKDVEWGAEVKARCESCWDNLTEHFAWNA